MNNLSSKTKAAIFEEILSKEPNFMLRYKNDILVARTFSTTQISKNEIEVIMWTEKESEL